MKRINPPALLLVGGIAVIGLTGCEQIEQAANDAVEQARQSAVEAIDQVRQAGSIEEAKQSASKALDEARQGAAGLLDQASQYLAEEGRATAGEDAPAGETPAAM